MKIYNTYTKKIEEFIPEKEKEVKMYVCGPTVYSYIHIGNARPTVFFDTVSRFLKSIGYKVTYVSNITDVNDKIFAKSKELGIDEFEHAKNMTNQYLKDISMLNVQEFDKLTSVVEYMDAIVKFIEKLIEDGFAYIAKNNDVYFRIDRIEDYGKLSGQVVEDLIAGSRVKQNDFKENPLDFVLWKSKALGKNFKASFGEGRPGWHTECVCMIADTFKSKIDIHGGGSDLIFPHHENEIAHSKALFGDNLANYWMHNSRVDLGTEKMSKSLGNVVWVKDLLTKHSGNAIRLLLLQNHYRQVINYTDELMDNAEKEVSKIYGVLKQVHLKLGLANISEKEVSSTLNEFNDEMSNDFNTSNALTVIYKSLKIINVLLRAKEIDYNQLSAEYNALSQMCNIFGLSFKLPEITEKVIETHKKWEQARTNKDFENADKYRNELVESGVL